MSKKTDETNQQSENENPAWEYCLEGVRQQISTAEENISEAPTTESPDYNPFVHRPLSLTDILHEERCLHEFKRFADIDDDQVIQEIINETKKALLQVQDEEDNELVLTEVALQNIFGEVNLYLQTRTQELVTQFELGDQHANVEIYAIPHTVAQLHLRKCYDAGGLNAEYMQAHSEDAFFLADVTTKNGASLKIFYPENTFESSADATQVFTELVDSYEEVIEDHTVLTEPINIVVLPSTAVINQYSKRNYAVVTPENVVEGIGYSYGHEMTHAAYYAKYELSRYGFIVEGLAVWEERNRFIRNGRRDLEVFPTYNVRAYMKEMFDDCAEEDVPLTSNEFSRLAYETLGADYYSTHYWRQDYDFGLLLMSAIVMEYGPDVLPIIYDKTNRQQHSFFNIMDGRQIVRNGEQVATDREYIEAAMLHAGVAPDVVKRNMKIIVEDTIHFS